MKTLKTFYKKIQNIDIKKDDEINAQEQFNETNMT